MYEFQNGNGIAARGGVGPVRRRIGRRLRPGERTLFERNRVRTDSIVIAA
jgi:hypothetical protein